MEIVKNIHNTYKIIKNITHRFNVVHPTNLGYIHQNKGISNLIIQ